MEPLTNIYNNQIPEYLKPYLKIESMKRLKGVSMNCGVNYTSLPLFQNISFYSRYEHSLNVALILEHFTHDHKIVLSGLFHDISTPSFSHTIDFLNHDYVNQESYEDKNVSFIMQDSLIMTQLNKAKITLDDVKDYQIYPLADNPTPRLSADRLEYTLSNAYYYHFVDREEVIKLYNNISIMDNEDGNQEFCFQDFHLAERFSLLSLQCGRVYSSKEDRFAMESLARLIHQAIELNILDMNDLYTNEEDIIQKLIHSDLKEEWISYTKLHKVISSKEYLKDSYIVDSKRRYINPLCVDGKRVSQSSDIINSEIKSFLNEDFNVYLKGE